MNESEGKSEADAHEGSRIEELAAAPARQETVCETSEIREVRTFSKREILEAMAQFAGDTGSELKATVVDRVVTNKEGTVVVLEVKLSSEDGTYEIINFTIKGRHGHNESATTNLDRTFFDSDGVPQGGAIIGEYLDGGWVARS